MKMEMEVECRCKSCMKPVPSPAWVEWKASLDAFQSGKTIPEIQEWLEKNPPPKDIAE